VASPEAGFPAITTLDQLTQLAIQQHPRLAQAGYEVEAATGRALQAGLPPNPEFNFTADELGDRTGVNGILSPRLSQEFVRGNKLRLARTAALKAVDQATLSLYAQRLSLMGSVRVAYFEAQTLQLRVQLLKDLVTLAEAGIETTQKLLEAKLIARLDLVQLEVEYERLKADQEAVEREIQPAYRRLAAVAGLPQQRIGALVNVLDQPLPVYDLEATQSAVLSSHPERMAAMAGVEQASFLLRRAQAEPIPNITLESGYVRQNQNRSDDWMIGFSMPIPLWNRNQGGVKEAAARFGEATQQVRRIEADLADRIAAAFRDYAAAKQRYERFQKGVIPKALEAYDLSVKAYQGGQFEYLRVIQAQRAYTQARLDALQALGQAWQAAAVLSGLAMEEQWPPAPSK
jgi:outer membrane protein, heavy metal efflux system